MKEKIIVTGSNGQLGKALVSMLLNYNYEVIGLDLTHDNNLKDHSDYIKITLDITNEDSVINFFKSLKNKENLAGLVNNAGIAVFSSFEERTYEEIKSVMDVNIAGTILMTKNFMKTNKHSQIPLRVVHRGSIYGFRL